MDFGRKRWQGKPRGGYWLAKEFYQWDEIAAIDNYALGVFFEHGVWAAGQKTDQLVRRALRVRGWDAKDRLQAAALWLPDGESFRTKTMDQLRFGRGSRGLVMVLSQHLYLGVEALKAGYGALGLYARSASWSLNTDTPGFIPSEIALKFGKAKLTGMLWESGLWLASEGGFRMSAGDHPVEMLWALARDDERAPILPGLRLRVYERDGYRCVLCGATDDLTLDHILPWSWGGPETEDNLRTLCRSCNSAKGAKF